jgi:hypothetical protein
MEYPQARTETVLATKMPCCEKAGPHGTCYCTTACGFTSVSISSQPLTLTALLIAAAIRFQRPLWAAPGVLGTLRALCYNGPTASAGDFRIGPLLPSMQLFAMPS